VRLYYDSRTLDQAALASAAIIVLLLGTGLFGSLRARRGVRA